MKPALRHWLDGVARRVCRRRDRLCSCSPSRPLTPVAGSGWPLRAVEAARALASPDRRSRGGSALPPYSRLSRSSVWWQGNPEMRTRRPRG